MNGHKSNTHELDLRPRISVIGVGGAGGNAVNNMIRAKLEGVEFVVANTDAQSMDQSLVMPEKRIQLGLHITQGLGAGSKPDVGRASAEESLDEVLGHLRGSNMVFITAGMGGGTGTGAAPVIARAVRESGILTVGVVTKPFNFEGTHRTRMAEKGIEELQQYVDTLIIIPNQNLFRVANEHTTFAQAFEMADNVLCSGVRNVTDLMMRPGLINLDFADIRAVMAEMGKAMMGTGEAEGDRRAVEAADISIDNPLLDDVSMKGAKGVLINITGGYDMTLYEVDEAANRVRENADPEANIIFGSTFDEKLNGRIRVSVVATGIGSSLAQQAAWRNAAAEQMSSSAYMAKGPTVNAAPAESLQNARHAVSAELDLAASQEAPAPAAPLGTNQQGYYSSPAPSTAPLDIPSYQQQSPGYAEPSPKVERKRSPSLFERFTGVGRQRSQEASMAEQTSKAQPSEDDRDHDVLDIPAFLRRGNQ
ncbi:cell division protein FtsZ [Candidatus Finniella inopinata]|uniref:Cell division protein FtsZ n=1 Tax=Candidatus Finniella inopinata TaxID=1696036 RepID=A0A4Q7DKK0_9PROT|nr:cell division protein FtsZ [Candidatus Finniella inopinata]RZI46849.1 cell division protein FtsZ [Candidatus Finniella inopinata]